MDPPQHSRLRSLLAAARSRRGRWLALEGRASTVPGGGRLSLAKSGTAGTGSRFDVVGRDLTADLPVWTLAEVLGLPPESDRYLLYDWSNRVIGYQDVDYAVERRVRTDGRQ